MKKRLLCLLPALVLALSLFASAYAEEAELEHGGTSSSGGINLTGTVNAPTEVISVDVAWDSMEFTYEPKQSAVIWNPATHKKDDKEAGWTIDSATITLTNHSNVAVDAKLNFTAAENMNGEITGTFYAGADSTDTVLTDSKLTLNSAVGTAKDNAPSAATTFKIGGDIPSEAVKGEDDKLTLGTISIKVAKATA